MSKFILILKFILRIILHLVPTSVVIEYAADEKRINKFCDNLKAQLNNMQAFEKTNVDDHIVDFGVRPLWLGLAKFLRKPDNQGIKWLNEKATDLKKLTE